MRRKSELDLTWDDIASRGGFSSHTIVYSLATKEELKQTPRHETLEKVAKALELPSEVVKVAAAEAAGFTFNQVGTTLHRATHLRMIAACLDRMSDADADKLVRLAEAFAGNDN